MGTIALNRTFSLYCQYFCLDDDHHVSTENWISTEFTRTCAHRPCGVLPISNVSISIESESKPAEISWFSAALHVTKHAAKCFDLKSQEYTHLLCDKFLLEHQCISAIADTWTLRTIYCTTHPRCVSREFWIHLCSTIYVYLLIQYTDTRYVMIALFNMCKCISQMLLPFSGGSSWLNCLSYLFCLVRKHKFFHVLQINIVALSWRVMAAIQVASAQFRR